MYTWKAGFGSHALHTPLPNVVLLGDNGFSRGIIVVVRGVIWLAVKCCLSMGAFYLGKGMIWLAVFLVAAEYFSVVTLSTQ